MSRAQSVVVGVVSGLAVGLLAGLAVVNIDTLGDAAAESDAVSGVAVVRGEVYEGDAAREARLVQSEAERLVYVRTVAAGAQFAEGMAPGPFQLRTGAGYTLVLTARAAPYGIDDLVALAPDTVSRQADAVYLLGGNVAVLEGATLDLRAPAVGEALEVRLRSDESGFAAIVALGGTLSITGSAEHPVSITSWNPRIGAADVRTADGRSYLRAVGGRAELSHVDVSDLGFWSGATGGLAVTGTDAGPSSVSDTGAADPAAPAGATTDDPAPAGAQLLRPRAAAVQAAPVPTATAALENVTVSGNAFGFFVTRARGVTVRDSEVRDSLVDGLVLHRSVTGSTVSGTVSSGNAMDGFRVSRSSTGNVFSDITAESNGRNGMFLDGQPLASGPSSAGTVVQTAGDNRISGSTFTGNARYGVAISGGEDVAVTGSLVEAGENGIVVDRGATGIELVGNTVRDQSGQAIALRDGVTGVKVSENVITGVDTGVYLRNAAAVVAGNRLSAISNHGVTLVGEADGVAVTGNTVAGSGSIAVFTENARGGAVAGNDLVAWRPAPTLDSVVRSIFQPLTVVWILVGLAVVLTGLATLSRRRGGIRHPYAERVPISTFTRGVVSRDSITTPR